MNEQELFWAGDFGNEYIERSDLEKFLPRYLGQWALMLDKFPTLPQQILELGCNIGINLHCLNLLMPQVKLHAVEINSTAVKQVRQSMGNKVTVYEGSLLNFVAPHQYDLTFTSGVLIHIAPENLPQAYDTLYNSSSKYILIRENYNRTPVAISYREHTNKLFKRDFCGELLDRYEDLHLIDYGFAYHRDPLFPMDDSNWFLLEKISK